MQRKLRSFLMVLACILLCTNATDGAVVRLRGTVPAEIDITSLQAESVRLEQVFFAPGFRKPPPLTVIFYGESNAPAAAAGLPEWGGGGATGPDTILLPIDKPFVVHRNMHQVVVHEMVHCMLIRACGDVALPRWFHEGAAMTLSGELSFEEGVLLARSVVGSSLLPLASIDSVNAFYQSKAQLAYSESHAVFAFLVEKFGVESVRQIVDASRRKRSFADGLERVLGVSLAEFEHLALRHVRERYGLGFLLGDLYAIWLLIIALAVVAFFVVWQRKRRKAAAMEEEEALPPEAPPADEPTA